MADLRGPHDRQLRGDASVLPGASSITIPYTFFKQQVVAGNVEEITSVGDSIQGTFKTEVTYPPLKPQPPSAGALASPSSNPPQPRTAMRFKTQRPVFADPGLETHSAVARPKNSSMEW